MLVTTKLLTESIVICSIVDLRQAFDKTREEEFTSQPWPAQTVLDAGVSFYVLLESYSIRLVEITANGGVDITTHLHWLASISEVLELWVSAAISSHGNLPMIGSNNLGLSKSASVDLTRAINAGLVRQIEMFNASLEDLVGCNASTVALVSYRFSKVKASIIDGFC